MNLAEAMAQIETAEDIFGLLDVAFDPAVLAVHRLQILKRFGQEIGALEHRQPPLSEVDRVALYAAALERAHQFCACGGSAVEPFLHPRPRAIVAVDRLRCTMGRANGN